MMSLGVWQLPDVDEVIALHAAMLATYGGTAGAANLKCIDGSIGAAINAALYQVDESGDPDLLCVAAHLLVYLARNHCFTDGNKRVAWAAAVRALDLNGIYIRGDESEAASLVERASTSEISASEVICWLGQPERLVARA